MRHRRRTSNGPTPLRKAAVGFAALAVVLSGAAASPGAIAQTTGDRGMTGSLTWFATDDTGSAVAETTYEVVGPDGMERPVVDNDGQDSNTTTGTVTLDELPVGEYTITQVGAPDGFEVGGEPQQVVVTEEGQEPAVPVTFVNAVVAAEDEVGDDQPAEEEAPVEEAPAEGPATEEGEQPATEETQQPATEEESVVEDGAESMATESGDDASSTDEVGAEAVASPAAIPPGTPGNNRAHIRVTKGGDRVGTSTTVTPLTGATFDFYRVDNGTTLTGGTLVGSCTTAPGDDGTCGVDVALPNNNNYFYVVETSAPAGWTAPLTWGTSSQYVRYNTGNIRRSDSSTDRIVTLPGTDRTFPDVRDNPSPPQQCGLRIALVYDLSNSVTGSPSLMAQYKAAGVGFVNALEGTPSSIALYTFGSNAPAQGSANGTLALTSVAASGDVVRNKINGLTATPDNAQGGTNWDMGLAQVDGGLYDVVLFLTDGEPTFYRDGQFDGVGNATSLRKVEESIHSANKVKEESSLIVVGIGGSVSQPDGQKRLSHLSSAYYTSGFDEVGQLLRDLALANCLGTLTVVKQERALDGTLSPGEDWTFSTPDGDVTPSSEETDQNGAVNFEVGGYSDTVTTRDITVAETQQPGFQLEQVGGFNAVCTNTATGLPVASANAGALGFTVPVPQDGAISCQVINTVHPTITLQKSWVDGLTGDSATLSINGQPTSPAVVSTVGGTPTFVDTTNVVTVGAVPGSTVTLAETLAGTGSYATDLSCVQGNDPVDITYTDGALSGSLTMPADSVACTFTNSQSLDDLTVSKTADTSYDRAYTWSIDKLADSDRVEVAEGSSATVEYDATVTAEDRIDSDITISGEITVTNDNPVPFTGVNVTDALPGASCAVTGGTNVTVPADSTATVSYECSASATEAVGDTNTASATWDVADYPGTSGSAAGTADVVFGDPDNETDRYVTVEDAFDGGTPVVLPLPDDADSLDWEDLGAGGSVTLEYTQEIAGEPGTCTTYPNVATVVGEDGEALDEDDAAVEVCVGMDLDIDKNVVLTMDRSFDYDLVKDVDETQLNVDPETGEATFTYTVTVTDGPATDSNWQMTGEITVTNPNAWPVDAVVSDEVFAGVDATCTVADPERAVPGATGGAPGTEVFTYSCDFDGQPAYAGTNVATVTWDAEEFFSPTGEATGPVEFTVDDWSVTPINETVTVIDDQTDPVNPVTLDEHTWTGEGNSQDYTYDLTLEGVPGECVTFTNTAWLEELTAIGDDQEVTVCWPEDVTVEKTVNAEFDREYHWLLTKEADQTEVTIGEDGTATFDYVVSATPDGFTDSGWTMSGEITVTNPNASAVTVQVTDTPDGLGADAACTVDAAELTVPGNGQATTAYTCTFDEEPAHQGGTNTATVTWTDISGDQQTASSAAEDVVFGVDGEAHLSVPVFDDKVTGTSPGELLGVAHFYDGPHTFEYSMTHPGEPGECTSYTNTAVIPEMDLDVQETVTVCVVLAPEVEKTAHASYDRLYAWDIVKDVDQTRLIADPETGTATFSYTVNAIPVDYTDSGWAMSGTITVTNPNSNAIDDLTATVTDLADVGGECTVDGGEDVVLAPGAEVTLDYTCTFEEEPSYTGANTATATWTGPEQTGGSSVGTAPVTFEEGTVTDLTVAVWDDQTDPEGDPVYLGEATWADPSTHEFTYELTLEGAPGECVDYTNTAWVELADGLGAEDEQDVTVCSEAGPEVSKTVEASYDRTYDWDLTKDVDATEVEITGTEATFSYVVTAIADGFVDSGWSMTGTISVHNPNQFDEGALTVTVTDLTDVGGTCAVEDGEDVTVAPGGTEVFEYTCTFTEQPAYAGTNTANVAWTDTAGDAQTTSDTVDVAFALDEETNLTVDVYDDQVFEDGDGVLLGTATWHESPVSFPYELTLPGTPGECVTHTNTAVIPDTGDEASADVTVCVEDELVITKTAQADFDREYFWDIQKEADQTQVTIDEGGTAEFTYLVSAIPGQFEDSGWAMSGQITVTNPNQYDEGTVTVEITDATDVGGTCEVVDGEGIVIAPGATEVFDYVCTFDAQPDYEGTNAATVTWTGPDQEPRAVSFELPVVFELDGETNRTVEVYDDQVFEVAPGELLGEATWNAEGTPTEFEYAMEFPGVVGECTDYTNTAVILDTGDQTDETVTVCVEAGPEVSKTAEASFDREYFWDLLKEADQTQVTIDEGGAAQFDYVVSAVPDGSEDSGWAMSGQISVTNPNDFDEMTVTVTDVADVGGTCEVVDGEGIVIAPGATEVFDYSCTFEEQPDYEGTNVAHVAWTDASGEEQSTTSLPAVVAFDLDGETNLEVEVYDDQVFEVAPGTLLGTANWLEGGTEFDYSMEFPGVVGECTDYSNTAVIPATGDEAEETVTVCVEAGPEVSKTAEADFDREYFWLLEKEADQTSVEITGTDATFTYVVSASADGSEDSGWAMSGQVTVTNPNDFAEMPVTVTDVADVGGTCAVVGGEDAVLEPGETRVFDYSCTFTTQPDYEGTNTAYVAWTDADGEDRTTTSDPVDVAFELDGETNLTVDVHDDKVTGEAPGELLGTATWHDGVTEFTYDLTLPGVAGECVDHTNTAVIPATGDEAEETVTICVEDELVITKTAQADFDREYFWDLQKEADRTEVTIGEGGVAEFAYVVSAEADGFEDSGWAMSGQITVTNPNEYDEGTVTVEVTDTTDVGGTCEVVDGEGVVIAPGATEVFDYSCTFEEQPDYEGSNVATVTWTGPDGSERTVTTDPVEVLFELDGETNLEVDVHDDKVTGEAPGELLGTANWHDDVTDFAYTMQFPGVAGECTDYTNTAVIPATGDETDETVTVCVELAPEVSKTAEAAFDRTYDWLIEKEVDRTHVVLAEDGTAQFNYVVSAVPNGFEDSGWEMSGQITVTNPNDFQEMAVTVTDLADVGGTCEVAGGEGAVLEPGQTRVFDYSCTFEEEPVYEGSNTAYVAWTDAAGEEQSTASDPVEVDFELAGETNLTVDVYDDKVTLESPGELLGTAHYYDGPFEFDYSLDLPGEVGTCVDHTNTAVVLDSISPTGLIAPQAIGDEASVEVTVCIEAAPEVSKTADADFDRTYDWELEKSVDRTEVHLDEAGDALFTYVVTATPDGFVDSGWEMSGQITVTNPNDFQEMAVTVTDAADVGGTCEVEGGEAVVLAPGETRVLDYACTFEEQPDYEGSNTAYVAWTNVDGVDQTTASDPVDVVFALDEEINVEVEVYDDLVTGEAPGELLGTATWHDGVTEFAYGLELPGVVGECVDYTNTAVIPATGDDAQQTVTVCVDEPEPPVPPTPEPPVIPTGDPVSGGSQWALVVAGITAMLLALLGAGAMLWRRREQQDG